jgi:chromosome segregation ATPase
MSNSDSDSFKLGREPLQSDIPDLQPPLNDREPETEQIEILQHRMRRQSALLLFLFILVGFLIFLLGYEKIQSSGQDESQMIADLNKRLEERFSSLSIRQAALEDSAGKTQASIKDATGAFDKKVKDAVSKMENGLSGKIGKDDLDKKLAEYQDQIAVLSRSLTSIKEALSEIRTVKEDFKSETKTLSAKLYDTVENVIKLQESHSGFESQLKSLGSVNTQTKATLDALQKDRVGKRDLVEQSEALRNDVAQQLDRFKRTTVDASSQYKIIESKISQIENSLQSHERDLVRIKLDLKFLKPGASTPNRSDGPTRSNGISEQPLQ